MGFVSRIFSPPAPKPAPAPAVRDTGPSASEIAAQEEEDAKKRRVAINAAGAPGQLTPAGGVQGDETNARKRLLGE